MRLPTESTILKVQVVPVSKTTGCVILSLGYSPSIDTAPYMHLYTDLLTCACGCTATFGAATVTLDVFNCPDKASDHLNTN